MLDDCVGVISQNANGQRIVKDESAFQNLVRRPVPSGPQRSATWPARLHVPSLVRGAPPVNEGMGLCSWQARRIRIVDTQSTLEIVRPDGRCSLAADQSRIEANRQSHKVLSVIR